MNWLKRFIAKRKYNRSTSLKTFCVYNTENNLIILIQYGINNAMDMIEFESGLYKSGLIAVFNQQSEEAAPEKEFSIRPVRVFDYRYYALVGGQPEKWADIYNYISISNPILENLTQIFYNKCCSVVFNKLIEYGVMDESEFKYRRIKPDCYDALLSTTNMMNSRQMLLFDNPKTIMDRLPKCFNSKDIIDLIHIYSKGEPWEGLSAKDVISRAVQSKTPEDSILYKILADPLYGYFMKNPDLQILSTILYPIFLVDTDNGDDDFATSGVMSFEDLDELFRKDYDRYDRPTIDSTEYYDKSVDEVETSS